MCVVCVLQAAPKAEEKKEDKKAPEAKGLPSLQVKKGSKK